MCDRCVSSFWRLCVGVSVSVAWARARVPSERRAPVDAPAEASLVAASAPSSLLPHARPQIILSDAAAAPSAPPYFIGGDGTPRREAADPALVPREDRGLPRRRPERHELVQALEQRPCVLRSAARLLPREDRAVRGPRWEHEGGAAAQLRARVPRRQGARRAIYPRPGGHDGLLPAARREEHLPLRLADLQQAAPPEGPGPGSPRRSYTAALIGRRAAIQGASGRGAAKASGAIEGAVGGAASGGRRAAGRDPQGVCGAAEGHLSVTTRSLSATVCGRAWHRWC